MARVTVEDCLQNVDNLFQLVLLASQRARRLANGAEPTLAGRTTRRRCVALREIAAGNITAEMLREPEPPPAEPLPEMEHEATLPRAAVRPRRLTSSPERRSPWTMRLRSWDCCPAEGARRA